MIAQWIVALAGVGGCALPLDPLPVGDAAEPPPPPQTKGCALFAGQTLSGPGVSWTGQSGEAIWLFGGAVASGQEDGIALTSPAATDPCASMAGAIDAALPASSATADNAVPLSSVEAAGKRWVYYQAWRQDPAMPFGVRTTGYGVANCAGPAGQCQRSAMLWTADRPNYGQAAWSDGEFLYVYGCENGTALLERHCFAARTVPGGVTDPTKYAYAIGVNQFSANVENAQPILADVGDLYVAAHRSGRLLFSYVTPLGSDIWVRTALGPTGPFSSPQRLLRCATLPGEFCVGGARHPQWEQSGQDVVVSWQLASFGKLELSRRQPVLARILLPKLLP